MINATSTLFMAFFRICIFRNKPQDLPQSQELLIVCLLAYAAINFLLTLNVTSAGSAVSSSLLETVLVCIITVVLLWLNHHPERWLKTLMAIAGTGCVIGIIALPLFYLTFVIRPGGLMQSIVLLLYLSLLVWNIVIMGNILRHALETSLAIGIVFAIIYIILTSMLVNQLIPAPEPA